MAGRRTTSRWMVVAGVIGGSALLAPAAGASSSQFPLKTVVNATTTIAKLNQTVVVPPGTFSGSLNTNTGRIKGKLKLPPASATVSLEGIGLATATFALAPTKAVTGRLSFSTGELTATSTFNILVTSVDPRGTSINLVGSRCRTSKPISLTFKGAISPISGGTVTGTYTIPSLEDCQLAAPVLSAMVAGPGNTFTASMTPE